MGFGGSGGGSSSIASSTDVALSSPSDSEVLTYDSATAKWKNKAPSGGAGGAVTIADLPAGSVLYARYDTTSSTWPARPTARTDIMVHWVGGDDTTPPPGALANLDIWDWTTS